MSSTDYLFNTDSDLGRSHLDHLEHLLDATTIEFLTEAALQPGQRCLDLGAGGGSITRWMAEQVGPEGRVVSMDMATDYLPEGPGIEVVQGDVNDGLPEGGPFHLIHARYLMMHLPRRKEILKWMVDALAPGGWVVLSDPGVRPLTALAAPDAEGLALWSRIDHLGHRVLAPNVGQSFSWAHEAPTRMAEVGLEEVFGLAHSTTSNGGEDGCLMLRHLIMQITEPLQAYGVTEEEIRGVGELLKNPEFRLWYYQTIFTRGRRPAE